LLTDLADTHDEATTGQKAFDLRDFDVGEFVVIDGRVQVLIVKVVGHDRVKLQISGHTTIERGRAVKKKPRDRRFRRMD
jgi:hypothetical protein